MPAIPYEEPREHFARHQSGIHFKRDEIIRLAETWLNTPYQLGGKAKTGIDCSGLVCLVYKDAVDSTLNEDLWWTESFKSSYKFIEVPQPDRGDLVWWPKTDDADAGFNHVAIVIYSSSGDFIGAQTSTGVAMANYMTNAYWSKRPRIFLRHATLF